MYPEYSNNYYRYDDNSRGNQINSMQQRLEVARQMNKKYKQAIAQNLIINSNPLSVSQTAKPENARSNFHPPTIDDRYKFKSSLHTTLNQQTNHSTNDRKFQEDDGDVTLSSESYSKSPTVDKSSFLPKFNSGEKSTVKQPTSEGTNTGGINTPSSLKNKQNPLEDITHDMDKVTDEHKQFLENIDKKNKKQPIKKHHDVDKLKSDSQPTKILPLWKHKLNGNDKPSIEFILKGKKLFRCIVRVFIQLILRPWKKAKRKKILKRSRLMKDFERSLDIMGGTLEEWIGKLVQMPLDSIVQDTTLDFEPKDSYVSKSIPLRTRMLQLKVRIKAILHNITNSPMPPDHVTNFLSQLIEEENYYPDWLLWKHEKLQLKFNSLGAMVETIQNIQSKESSEIIEQFDANGLLISTNIFYGTKLLPMEGDITRIRMIIQNFIFIRILINRIVLSPWSCGLSKEPPKRNIKRIIDNLRYTGSIFYDFLYQSIDPQLPQIEPVNSYDVLKIQNRRKQENDALRLSTPESVAVKYNADAPIPKDLYIKDGIDVTTAFGLKVKENVEKTVDNNPLDSPRSGRSSKWFQTIRDGDKNTSLNNIEEKKPPTSLFNHILQFAGIIDEKSMYQNFAAGSLEDQLLHDRTPYYMTMEEIHSFLFPNQILQNIRMDYLNDWYKEWKESYVIWINNLVRHVIKQHVEKHLHEKSFHIFDQSVKY